MKCFAPVAQLIEHLTSDQDLVHEMFFLDLAPGAQLIEHLTSDQNLVYEMLLLNLAPVAQLIEHLTSQKVLGSNPSWSRFFSGFMSLSLFQYTSTWLFRLFTIIIILMIFVLPIYSPFQILCHKWTNGQRKQCQRTDIIMLYQVSLTSGLMRYRDYSCFINLTNVGLES